MEMVEVEEDKGTILVIEDNSLNMKLIRTLLEINGNDVVEAQNAEIGIEVAKSLCPDLILMDIELPGISGLDATRMIRNDPKTKDVPIIALSANAMDDDRKKGLSAGCDDYITKPVNIKTFANQVNRHLFKTKRRVSINNAICGHRILIVDDEPLNVKLLSALLISKGYHVLTAGDGKEAINRVRKERPDLIMLDIMMPGMDGYEVTKVLKADPDTKNIPIIMVTALKGEDEKKRGLDAGADEFINKPVNHQELEARVLSLLRLKEYQDQLINRRQSQTLMVQGLLENEEENTIDQDVPTILIVEDDPTSAKLLSRYLSNIPCKIEITDNGENALERSSSEDIDVMLLDLMLPSIDGIEVCSAIKENDNTIPIQVVMITSLYDTKSKLRAIQAGTDDFLVKPINKDEFRARIKSLIKKKAYLDQLRANAGDALKAAITDKLTGLYNQGYLKHFIQLEFKRSNRHNQPLALLMIDVDSLKSFNDKYGHQFGDECIRLIAKRIKGNIRDIDLAARYGGDEFTVVLPYANVDVAKNVAKRLLMKISDRHEILDTTDASITVSIGISLFPDFCDSPDNLIRTADIALYAAKDKGKNQVCVYAETIDQI